MKMYKYKLVMTDGTNHDIKQNNKFIYFKFQKYNQQIQTKQKKFKLINLDQFDTEQNQIDYMKKNNFYSCPTSNNLMFELIENICDKYHFKLVNLSVGNNKYDDQLPNVIQSICDNRLIDINEKLEQIKFLEECYLLEISKIKFIKNDFYFQISNNGTIKSNFNDEKLFKDICHWTEFL